MSTPCEEIRPELEALLAAMTEGKLDAAGRKRLAEILHDHPDARQVYLDYCQMHAMLREAHGELSAFAKPKRRYPWVGAAAGLLAAVLLPWLIRVYSDTGATRDGKRISEGQGVAHGDIVYKDGSRVTLEYPAETSVYKDRLVLDKGVARFDIQPRSTPYTIKTPEAEATVLGTKFELASEKDETRLSVGEGRVKLASAGKDVVAGAGELATSDGRELARWTPVCDLTFKELPPEIESVFSPSKTLHTPERTVKAEPLGRLVPGGFHLGTPGHEHGLSVWRWTKEVGDDLLIEVDVAGGQAWSLGLSVSGDSFEGYRVIFAGLDRYPHGVAIDTIHPVDCVLLAQDPRPIRYDKDHTLRVERKGRRMRVWIDRELRIDTEITHALPEGRRRTFALSNYGAPPLLRALRVWKLSP